ncbi:DUF1990 domain-containing protein [Pseudarthrobacter sp. H3Y2-7]|jgi:uncharacterized protein (UPF0548 family)|uniref:DUF1990 family protein n=1 Tax=Pseudarthrobacter TaxID=1742993 RepID=UPI0023B16BF9|nr:MULTISPECIES: DUF1990 domain-containing protein [unclassified Pseudarthrobacter]MDE8668762.1 DUF1990 domain-containing protein [Pseudarthrobacter sp. H3Y2-7]
MTEKRLVGGRLDYPGVGATENGRPPAGYPSQMSQVYLGDGPELYRRVAQGILSWELQRRSGLRVRAESSVVRPGTRVVSGFGVGPFRVNAPCEVVWVRRPGPGDGPQSAGFGYGTLPGHPARGEEAFEVEMDATGQVFLKITAFSKPANWFYRAGGVVTRAAQRYVTSRYVEGARQLAAGES